MINNTKFQKVDSNRRILAFQVASAQKLLSNKLLEINLSHSEISPYNQRYFQRHIINIKSVLERFEKILYTALNHRIIPIENFVLIDYGGGCGLLSFLAKALGIGTVIYNDIYDVSCRDVDTLSSILGLPLDHIVCGDLDALITYLHTNSISADAIVSNDVIEHIYDVESHFKILASLSDRNFRVVYSTNAIISNPVYVHLVKKSQISVENRNRKKEWGDKERDSSKAYLELRKDIILAYASDLNADDVRYLSKKTRGLIKSDIEKCVDQYRLHGDIDYSPDHPTNTCDPYTGNWCEHLMNLDWLQQVVQDAGFSTELFCGYYAIAGSPPKKIVKFVLNCIIRVLGTRGMFAAPYFILCADRKQTDS